jgi:hypothetical protein
MWSSRTYTGAGNCAVTAGAGGAPFYTLAGIKAACPNATAIAFGVNVGTNNPSYNVETDLVNFNGTAYNFEITNVPTNKNQCKNGGYANYTDANGNAFANQGKCVAFLTNGKNRVVTKNINKVRITNNNNLTVTNSNSQGAVSGSANVSGNTNGGSATSGRAVNTNTTTTTLTVVNSTPVTSNNTTTITIQ